MMLAFGTWTKPPPSSGTIAPFAETSAHNITTVLSRRPKPTVRKSNKTTRISYEDVGQMDMYLQMYDDHKRSEGDNLTIGIILCADTNADVARYSSLAKNKQLYASKYLTYMPSTEELRQEIERQKEIYRLSRPDDSPELMSD